MNIIVQLKREIYALFLSPIVYVMLIAATVINSGVFLAILDFLSNPQSGHVAVMQLMFGGTTFFYILLIVVSPLITMRLIAEEKHLGTLETLLTAPINEAQVVIAKYLAAVVFYIVLWLPTLAYPLILSRFSEIELGPVLAGYLGTVGMGMMFLAVNLFFSAVAKNQIVAALLSFGANMVLFIIGIFASISMAAAPDSLLNYMNLWAHMEDFGRGIVDTRYLVYYASIILFVLFCTVQALQARRWRG